jgi:hypothetical protein
MDQATQIHGRRLCSSLAALCLLMMCATGPDAVAALPAPSTFVQCFADGNNNFHATECTQGGFPGVPPFAFASASLSPSPSVSVEVISPPTAVLGAGADANSTYYFQVTGGNVGDVVPIMADFTLSMFSTADSSALAKIIIRTSVVSFTVAEIACNPQECDESEVSDTLTFQARSGANFDSVTLYAMAQAPATRVSHETARAYADPFIYVDPAFANASLYSIVVSPGVANVPLTPVPEPGPVVLLSIGTVAIALLRRRSRSQA